MTLGERLKAERSARGLSLKEAADELGCNQNSYRFWELGVQRPGPERLERIRQWIRIDAATLLEELSAGASKPGLLAYAS